MKCELIYNCIIRLSVLSVFFVGVIDKVYSQQIIVSNNVSKCRTAMPLIIKRKDLLSIQNELYPVVISDNKDTIPSQIDDLDNDGKWDEISFLVNIGGHNTKTFLIEWVEREKKPHFLKLTNVRFGKLVSAGNIKELLTDIHGKYALPRGGDTGKPYPYQMDGPAWENDKIAFRHYFDGRNCRDVFAKKVPYNVLDSVGIGISGNPEDTYHVTNDWGRDILSVGSSFGLGGLAYMYKDSLVRLGVKNNCVTDNIDSTRYTLITEGSVRAVLKLDFYGWEIGFSKIRVSQTITIWAGRYGYENEVEISGFPEGGYLVTGIVTNNNNAPHRLRSYEEKYISLSTHDKQTYNKEWYMGMSIIVPCVNYLKCFDVEKVKTDIKETMFISLFPEDTNKYVFYIASASELADVKFRFSNDYYKMIDDYVYDIANPLLLSVF